MPHAHGLHEQLCALTAEIAELCDLAGTAMHYATDALLYADVSLADDTSNTREHIIRQCVQLEADAHRLLAAYTPVAGDLRTVLDALKDAADLDCMAALAGHVARITHLHYPAAFMPPPISNHFLDLARTCVHVANGTKHLVLSPDSDHAAQVAVGREAMDNIHRDLFTIINDATWLHRTQSTASITLLSCYYERFARHVIDIANRAIDRTLSTHR
jgi:phosphate transport system protein